MRQSPVHIDDYAETAGARRATTLATCGHQPGDPARAADAIITAVGAPRPPLRLLLAAYDIASARLESLRAGFDEWRDLTRSTAPTTVDNATSENPRLAQKSRSCSPRITVDAADSPRAAIRVTEAAERNLFLRG